MLRFLFIFLFALLVGLIVFVSKYTIFTMPPSNDGGVSVSLILKDNKMSLFESADSICLENQMSSSYFCRVSVFEEILESKKIVKKIPYFDVFYELSLLFHDKEKIKSNITLSSYEESALDLLTGGQQLKAIILFAKVNGYEIYSINDLEKFIEEEDLSKKIPSYNSSSYYYSFGTLYLKDNLSTEVCLALKESYEGAVIYKEGLVSDNKFGCYINDFRPIFFYN